MARVKEFDFDRALENALRLFWEKGYGATSVQDLVDATGVNRASLYETFGSKHDLFEKALQRFAGDQSVAQSTCGIEPGIARIREAFHRAGRESSHDPRGCFMVNAIVECANRDERIQEFGRAARERLENFFLESLRAAERAGELAPGKDLRALARFLSNALLGLRVTAKTRPSEQAIRDILATTLAVLE